MKKNFKYIAVLFLVLSPVLYGAVGKLQNVDFATAAQITGAGGTVAQLLNTSKIYDSTNSQLLDTTIAGKLNTSAFTDAAVTGKLITGYVSGAGVVAATDSILQAIQKLNGNISAIVDTGITQLTGDVTAGPGSGSQVATIAALAVDNGKIANATIDLTTKVTGILPNANTTADSANTASAIVARDGSGNFSAGTITAALSGNATTSTSLAANPTDCGAGTKATAIDAQGNLTCTAVSLTADVSGTLPVANGGTGQTSYTDGQLLIGNSTGNTLTKSTLTAGSNITITNGGGSITIASTGGSSTLAQATKSANYTLTNSDDVIYCNGTITITLQSSASATSKPYRIKNISTNNCTISPAGGDLIDGQESLIISAKYASVDLIPDGGTAWYIF
jgi:hypothetical protein